MIFLKLTKKNILRDRTVLIKSIEVDNFFWHKGRITEIIENERGRKLTGIKAMKGITAGTI
ncbi:MAG: hypothetical protein A3F67_00035 [Verrucomicrobia bacterium RIFCSPHIGHO2_12_FULL_41_10]|nr:MAG: hypothetical protein A3F67_00035 [Verrucomicrobia bacterium RIFCSPHIGHO2_12_FULL_41_10]